MTKKKTAKRKSTAKQAPTKSIVERLEGTIVSQPIAIANKVFLAGLGLVSYIQSDIDTKFSELAKDGEAVRDQYQASLAELRGSLIDHVNALRNRVVNGAKPFARKLAASAPVPTANDVQELSSKLDKVLAEVAK